MAKKKYMITNTTIKPIRKDPKTGEDLRRAVEINGHGVQWRDHEGAIRNIKPHDNPKFVNEDEITEGLRKLASGGLIRIDAVDNVSDAMKQHAVPNPPPAPKAEPVPMPKAEARPDLAKEEPAPEPEVQEEAAPAAEEIQKVKAVEMGKDDHGASQPGDKTGYEGAINPDGPDNFTVTAEPKKKGRRKKKFEEQAS